MTPALFSLAGKTAIVTGATGGIGLAIAETLAAAGVAVLVSSEDGGDTEATAARLAGAGHRANGVAGDITAPATREALVAGALALGDGLDILICNAGIAGTPGPIACMDVDDYARVIDVNLTATVELARLALPHIAKRTGGSVVLMASIAGLRGNGAIGAYALAKAAVIQLARNLAVEWGPKGVRVNAISPGLIDTPLSAPLLADPAFMTRRMAMTPLRRPGTAAEVAGAALFLASPAAGFVTGHNLVVDGGTTITDGS
ncbi:SDR family oxidoreductase [Sphingomonas sp. MMSM20]|uniref:SDR family NAD(P)-dependent oxidoreductase n=1 Tax=Sphingomonas lycopersici TaxID=2951807 RepID=UPI002237FF24|nr:SDR family NAD(P)-dependent oxidoreductase [Sphingomonas lycopersici]MCW6528630.1 SDR family oxidoreductase [Sphingomonas lycopersici]